MEHIHIFLFKRKKPSPNPVNLHTLLLCPVPFLSCHLACLFWPGSLSSFLSSTERFLAGQDRLFSRLGVYLAIWLFAWDSKYFPIRKHYTSVLPILLLLSSKALWFFSLPLAMLCASTSNHEQHWLCFSVCWECRAPVPSVSLGPAQCEMRNSSPSCPW